jgi:hypothetical protein
MEENSPEPCAWCNGSGNDPKSSVFGPPNICPVCGGQGSLKVTQPAMRCARCEGTGRSHNVWELTRCPICQGSGWAHANVQRDSKPDVISDRSYREKERLEDYRKHRENDRQEEYIKRRNQLDVQLRQAEQARQLELAEAKRRAEAERQRRFELDQKISSSENSISKGDYYLQNDLFEDAIACYEESIRIMPSPTAWIKKGLAFFKYEEYEKAIRCYVEAICLIQIMRRLGIIKAARLQSKENMMGQ